MGLREQPSDELALAGLNHLIWRGRRLLHFSGCDYFRLARSTRLVASAASLMNKEGLNVAASRITTGNRSLYAKLEESLAEFFRFTSAVLLNSGYSASLAAAQGLAGTFTHAFVDEWAHGALQDAARYLNCPVMVFRHRDVGHLRSLLAKPGKLSRPVILTDGLFSHDGSVAPLREYMKILPREGRILLDDAHGAGVLGATGGGAAEAAGVGHERIILCASLAKAFGSAGGVVLCDSRIRSQIFERSGIFKGSTPLPPPLAGAALTAARLLQKSASRRFRLHQHTRQVREQLKITGWPIPENPGPIVRLPDLSPAASTCLGSQLLKAGIYPSQLRYSAASESAAFRFVISSEHSVEDLKRLTRALDSFEAFNRLL